MLFVIGLILPTPRGELLLRSKRAAPAASRHNTIQLGSQALDKVANGPTFPDVFLKVDHTKSILRFNIWFMDRLHSEKKVPATGRYIAAGSTGGPFRTIQPRWVEIVRKGTSRCRHTAILARGRHLWILLQFLRHPLCSFPPITILGVRRSAFCRLRWLIRYTSISKS